MFAAGFADFDDAYAGGGDYRSGDGAGDCGDQSAGGQVDIYVVADNGADCGGIDDGDIYDRKVAILVMRARIVILLYFCGLIFKTE